ncbi:MAG: hypothetical protein OXI33_18425 [Chloroflexota bacterium]|nr:hypothetical protein [Chloroflexota bacterium]
MLYEPGGYEIGLRQRTAARREMQSARPARARERPSQSPHPYIDFVPDAGPEQ